MKVTFSRGLWASDREQFVVEFTTPNVAAHAAFSPHHAEIWDILYDTSQRISKLAGGNTITYPVVTTSPDNVQ